jgi:hypothetical protein
MILLTFFSSTLFLFGIPLAVFFFDLFRVGFIIVGAMGIILLLVKLTPRL